MAKEIQKYETIMVFTLSQGEELVKTLSDKFKTLIEQNATIDKVDEWGKRRFAYPINDEMEGYYIYMEYTCKPDFPAELDRVFKITDGVLRTLIVCHEETQTSAPPRQSYQQAAQTAPAPVQAAPAAPAAPAPAVEAEAAAPAVEEAAAEPAPATETTEA